MASLESLSALPLAVQLELVNLIEQFEHETSVTDISPQWRTICPRKRHRGAGRASWS
jgi:hypothetical protein